MDIEKLIEAIKLYGIDTDTALYSLQAENKRLRAELEQVKREKEGLEAVLEGMKNG